MTHNTLQSWQRREPFEPFVVILSNGEQYEVPHSENAALMRTNVLITEPDTDSDAELALRHVASVERMETSDTAARES